MSNSAPVVILAEDTRQARLVRAYLRVKYPNLHRREIHDAPMANGQGAGEQWVREHYVNEVLAHLISRGKNPNKRRPEKWLIIVIDADKLTVQDRLNEFRRRIMESNDERVRKCRVEVANIAHLIPKRSVETWIKNLNGETVDEKTPYKSQNRPWDRMIPPAAVVLHEWVRGGEDQTDRCTPSLKPGIEELRRLTT
jgi:hypothetical protein